MIIFLAKGLYFFSNAHYYCWEVFVTDTGWTKKVTSCAELCAHFDSQKDYQCKIALGMERERGKKATLDVRERESDSSTKNDLHTPKKEAQAIKYAPSLFFFFFLTIAVCHIIIMRGGRSINQYFIMTLQRALFIVCVPSCGKLWVLLNAFPLFCFVPGSRFGQILLPPGQLDQRVLQHWPQPASNTAPRQGCSGRGRRRSSSKQCVQCCRGGDVSDGSQEATLKLN